MYMTNFSYLSYFFIAGNFKIEFGVHYNFARILLRQCKTEQKATET